MKVISAPLAILVDAVSYLVSGLVLTRLRTVEPVSRPATRHLGRELRDGLAWVYRHRMLAPLALTSHAWFLCTGMIGVVYPYFVLGELGFDAFALGVTFALAGVGGLAGASLSGWVVRRFGSGPAMVAGRLLTPVAFVLVPFAGAGPTGLVLLGAAQLLFGLSIGLDGPAEMGFRQAVTPDRLQGRMNATMRSMNRGMIVIGAPLGGALADTRPTLWLATAGLLAQAVALTAAPLRGARLPA